MKKANYTYVFKSSKTPEEIFSILTDVKRWWYGLFDETINGKSEKPGDEFTFQAGGGMHSTTQKLVELVQGKTISWLITDSELTFLKDPSEWNGTLIRFDLSGDGKVTEVTFTHQGLIPEMECYSNCSAAWTSYLDNLKKALK